MISGLRFLYWTFRRNRRDAMHMLAALPACLCAIIRLLHFVRKARPRHPLVAIALIEHMGDIVAAEPIARLARQRFPQGRICWISHAAYASLPSSYPEIDHVVIVRCLTEWMLLQRLRLFDVVWDLHINGRMCPRCCIPQDKPGTLPEQRNYFDYGSLLDVQCCSAGLPKLTDGPVLTPPPAAAAAVDSVALSPRFIAIHCISNEPCKDWPASKWETLIARILAADPTASVVEVGLRPLLVPQDHTRHRSLCGTLSLLEMAEVIRRAALFIGIDSGPAHLANAVGTQGVVLLGSYRSFRCYTPYSGGYASGETADIVRADGPVAGLPVEPVLAAVAARLARRPEPASWMSGRGSGYCGRSRPMRCA
jgi:ADP-heptose:LPS heptosyltransferase